MGTLRMQEASGGTDPSTWAGYAAQLLGAGALGVLLRELVKRIFDRADKGDDVAAGLRGEMVRRIESLERNYSRLEISERETFRRAVKLEGENRQLRERWHALMNWFAQHPELPQPPPWLNERISGPTERRHDSPSAESDS